MFCAGIDLGTLAEMGQVTSEDGDVARKAIQFYKIIRAFQNYFMDIERVSLDSRGIYLVLQQKGGIITTYSIPPVLVSEACDRCSS